MIRGSIVALLLLLGYSSDAADVRVHVDASWPTDTYSPLREASEFLAKSDERLLWRMLSLPPLEIADSAADGEVVDQTVTALSVFFDSPAMGRLLKMSLQMRSYMPTVQAYAQAATCASHYLLLNATPHNTTAFSPRIL